MGFDRAFRLLPRFSLGNVASFRFSALGVLEGVFVCVLTRGFLQKVFNALVTHDRGKPCRTWT